MTPPKVEQDPILAGDKGGSLGPKKDKYKVCSLVHKAPTKSLCLILGPSHENHNLFRIDLKRTFVYLYDSKKIWWYLLGQLWFKIDLEIDDLSTLSLFF